MSKTTITTPTTTKYINACDDKYEITIKSFFDLGGQNKIYRGVLKEKGVEGGVQMEVILKTAQIDKNQRFQAYLAMEQQIYDKLKNNKVEGVVKSHGIATVKNPFNNNAEEQHMVLEYCQYGSLHALSIFTKPYDEPTAFVVMR
jgi:serine/threonine protein kinase